MNNDIDTNESTSQEAEASVNTSNVRHTVAPLQMDLIKEFFTNKELKFIIDYANSTLKDKVFLTYLSNLDLPCDVEISDDVDTESRYGLLDAYFTIKTINGIPLLDELAAHVILKAKGVPAQDVLPVTALTSEQVDAYISSRGEMLNKVMTFIDSSMVFLIYSIGELNNELKVEESFPVIDDHDYVGLNIVNMFTIPGFLESYFSADDSRPLYFFKQQFTSHMFKGKSFFAYYNNEHNFFVPLMLNIMDRTIPVNPLELFPNLAEVIGRSEVPEKE